MKTNKISTKIVTTVILALLTTVATLTTLSLVSQNRMLASAEEQQLLGLYQSFNKMIQEREQMALALAISVAEMPEVQKAFAVRDRQILTDLLLSSYKALDEAYDIPRRNSICHPLLLSYACIN